MERHEATVQIRKLTQRNLMIMRTIRAMHWGFELPSTDPMFTREALEAEHTNNELRILDLLDAKYEGAEAIGKFDTESMTVTVGDMINF